MFSMGAIKSRTLQYYYISMATSMHVIYGAITCATIFFPVLNHFFPSCVPLYSTIMLLTYIFNCIAILHFSCTNPKYVQILLIID